MSIATLAIIAISITVVGLGAAIYGLADALKEYRFTRSHEVGTARRMYARSTLRSQILRTVKLTALLGIGVMAALDLPNRRAINIVLLMTVIVLTAADAIADRIVSRRIVGHIRKRYERQQDDPDSDDGFL